MKILYFFIFFYTCFSQDAEKGYKFVNKYILNKETKTSYETITEMRFKGVNIYTNFSALMIFSKIEGNQQNSKYNLTYDNIVASTRMDEKIKPDHKLNKLKDEIFTITVDLDGWAIDKNAKTKFGREFLETSEMAFQNYYFPFGSDSLRKPGDSWTVTTNNSFSQQPGFKSAEGNMISNVTYNFKKVKEKKGVIIAYINYRGTIEGDGFYSLLGISMKSINTGSANGKITYDITNGKVLKNKSEVDLEFKMSRIGGDKEIKVYQSMSTLIKNKD